MKNVNVILSRTVAGVGSVGAVVSVKAGYAKNYLVARKMASYATKANVASLERDRELLLQKQVVEQGDASAVAELLNNKIFILVRAASDDGRLYGSVASRDVIALVNKFISDQENVRGVEICRGNVDLGRGIKQIGMHEVSIRLYGDICTGIKLNVCRSESEADNSVQQDQVESE